ncbi:MAG TPA: hypothetical protein DD490_31265 [Acidobacteria bacterium]|nr:hypothetical protein [Acidobacteriota bacterium]
MTGHRPLAALALVAMGGLGCGEEPAAPESHPLPLRSGQYLHLIVGQTGTDVVATVRDPAGRLLLEVDSPNGTSGPEEVFLVAGSSGLHSLTLTAWGTPAAVGAADRSVLRLAALRPATGEDRIRAAAVGAFSRARLRERDDPAAAMEGFRESMRLWMELSEGARAAWALVRLGRLQVGDPAVLRAGAESLSQAAGLFGRAGDPRQQALILYEAGEAWLQQGETGRAEEHFAQASLLWERLGEREEQAARWTDLARVRMRQGRPHDAIDLSVRALAVWQQEGAWISLATTRVNLAGLYASLGEDRRALDQLRRALALLQEQPEPGLRAVALTKLGDVLLRLEGPRAALEPLREALDLRRRRRDVRGQAVTLNNVGRAQLAANRPLQALRALEASAEIFRRLGEPRALASVLNSLGLAYERLDRPGRAEEHYRQALVAAGETRHPAAEETSLFGLARTARRAGRLDEAERWWERTQQVAEESRSRLWRPDLRSSYDAARREQTAFLLDLLAERHRRDPRGGHEARAFAAAERAQARSLLDLLAAARHHPRPEELRRLDGLSRRLNERHRALVAAPAGPSEDLEGDLSSLLEDFRQAEAAVAGPLRALQGGPPTLSLRRVQEELLDDDTLLLEFFLGEERSHLWAVTSGTVRFVSRLPGRRQIEEAARRTHQRMKESRWQTGELAARQAAEQLSRMLLGPVADLLGRRRLVLVAPGALQVVPFAALPHPGEVAVARLLMEDHEIVTLPSASVLGALRARLAGRTPPRGLLAVLADPVREAGLPFARAEAGAILALAAGAPVLSASGPAASRSLVVSGRLRDYRILHFATHGLYDDVHPELSSLALAAFDASGRPVDGHLRAYEIAALDLQADLVVLSACRTAPGEEGLVGLTQGFLLAGAPRLVVSLWEVDDRATAELMQRFYTALLREKLSPAQALRQAQISLLRSQRWHAPYHWAGFVLQGDWRSADHD